MHKVVSDSDRMSLRQLCRRAAGWLARMLRGRAQGQPCEMRGEELIRAHAELVRLNRERSEFLAMMNHEIRTPMTSILGFSDLLTREVDSPSARRAHAQAVQRNAQRLMRTMNEILDMARIDAGRLRVEARPCSVHTILSELVSDLEPLTTEQGNTVELASTSPIPEWIEADPHLLRQALGTVISGAVRHTEHGEVTISLGFVPQGGTGGLVRVRVRDTAGGIPTDELDKMFRRFDAEDTDAARRFGGAGLGLAVSDAMVRAMGGSLAASSDLGVGTTLEIELPAARSGDLIPQVDVFTAEEPPEPIVLAAAGQEPADGPSGVHLRGVRVLLVDDGPDNLELMSIRLKRAGATVRTAVHGKQALDIVAESGVFDVILMDIDMPVMDGCTATAYLRGRGYSNPILALTAHALDDERDLFLDAGCDEVLTKPIAAADLVDRVRAASGKLAA